MIIKVFNFEQSVVTITGGNNSTLDILDILTVVHTGKGSVRKFLRTIGPHSVVQMLTHCASIGGYLGITIMKSQTLQHYY